MTTPQSSVSLAIVAHEDVYLSIVELRDGWGDAYEKKAAVLRLSKADLQKLGLKDSARVELTGPGGSVVVTAKPDATREAGVGLMPSSLYTNRLVIHKPGSSTLPGRLIEAQIMPTEKEVTPVSELRVRRIRA